MKQRLLKMIEEKCSKRDLVVASRDHHAMRPPRPCGITIHPGTGCTYECKYCYIYDMGFENKLTPYPLNNIQLVYALLSNKWFIPGERGTYLAIGSITEPFHSLIRDRTIEYIEAIYTYLGNPTQFSTKQYIDPGTARKIAEISKGKISPLVTIVSFKHYEEIEPRAPKPDLRLESIKNLKEAGLKPFIFLRPIIPGITEHEVAEVLEKASEYGATGVVSGSLRVTKSIIDKLRESGVDVSHILKRAMIPLEKMKPRIQYNVYTSDIKQLIDKQASRLGLIHYSSACMANLHTHGLTCWKICMKNTVECTDLLKPNKEEIYEIVKELGGVLISTRFENSVLYVKVKCKTCDLRLISEYLRSRYLACVKTLH